ncbi:MAG: hypothetical protein HY042_01690, partial [Spirochaetia bacterium]|nr:hypothetical protein [Spirochaetia bacterium]
EAQEELLGNLLRAGVKPYYLHQCDEVRGVSHFRVPVERGKEIMRALRGRNPGIALPVYVIDLPGGGGKVPVAVDYCAGETADVDGTRRTLYKNYEGRIFKTLSDDQPEPREQ